MFSCLLRCAISLALFSLLARSDAQSYIYDAGSPTYGVNIPVENGFINVTNGNLHMEFPLAQHPQRGALKLNERLVYDSHFWKIGHYSNNYWWPDNVTRTPQLAAGWRFVNGGETGSLFTNAYFYGESQCTDYADNVPASHRDSYGLSWTWTDPAGTVHPFNAGYTYTETDCYGEPVHTENQSGVATDASGYTLTATGTDDSQPSSITIRDNNGNQVYPNVADRYGNFWSTDSSGNLVDDRGQTPVVVSYSGNHIYYDVLRQGGGRARYTVTTVQVTPHTLFVEPGVAEYPNGSNAVVLNAVQSIQLPDGSSYSFQYDNGYAMITNVTLPTGGQISYGWSNYQDSYNNKNRWLTSRTVGSDPSSTFTPKVVTTCGSNQQNCHEQVSVLEPRGDGTLYDMQLNNGAWNVNTKRYTGGVPGGTQSGGGAAPVGTLVSSTDTTYDFSNACGSTCTGSAFITAQNVTTTLADTGFKRTDVYTYSNNQLGLLSAKKVYDFYTTSLPSQPMQQTQYTYANTAVPADLSFVTQTDGPGNPISMRKYTYTSSAQPTSGLVGHDLNRSLGVYPQTVGDWVNTDGSYVTTNFTIDDAGTVHSQWRSAGGVNYAATTFATEATDTFISGTTLPSVNGVTMSSGSTSDSTVGVPISSSDYNGQVTSYLNYDALNRVGEIDYPDGGYAKFTRAPTSTFVYTRTSSQDAVNATQLDAFGRSSRTAVATGQSAHPWYQADTCYNSNGQVSFTSLPYAGPGWSQAPVCAGSGTQYTYDSFGRPYDVTTPEGTTHYRYLGRATSITDVNGVQRITQIDGLGRPTAVCEVSSQDVKNEVRQNCNLDFPGTGYLTTYSYNDVNHKTTVTQSAQTRWFQTDSLGRTVLMAEPERAVATTYTYAYNATGLLTTRTRPQANQTNPNLITNTNTQYDILDRPVSTAYLKAGQYTWTRNFTYDVAPSTTYGKPQYPKGRLTSATFASNSTYFNYDLMGRVQNSTQCFGPCAFQLGFSYGYDYGGNRTSEMFLRPGSSTWQGFSSSYTVAGELASMTASGTDYTGSANANGALVSSVQQDVFGPDSFTYGNGLVGFTSYDSMGRRHGVYDCVQGSTTNCPYSHRTDYSGSRVTLLADSALNVGLDTRFTYDSLNRLSGVSFPGMGKAYNMEFDRYGNRWKQTYTQGSGPQPSVIFDPATNRMSGMAYDLSGNLTNDGLHSYTYDDDGNMTAVDGSNTSMDAYDALNHRTQSLPNGVYTLYGYDADGRRVLTFDGNSGNLVSTNVFWGDRLLATYKGGQVYFQHVDALGTVRASTNASGAVAGTFVSLPFGDGYVTSGTDADPQHFAELDKDYGDTHNAQYRQYDSAQARWMSPDPYDGSYDLANPQSLNRYAYALNMPLSETDPSGQFLGSGDWGLGSGAGLAAGLACGGGPLGIACGLAANLVEHVFESLFFNKPAFKGSLDPRPGARGGSTDDPWNESLGYPKGGPQLGGGWGVAGALGISLDAGCEFGPCTFERPRNGGKIPNSGNAVYRGDISRFIEFAQVSGFHLSSPDQLLSDAGYSGHHGFAMRNNSVICNVHLNAVQGAGEVSVGTHYDVISPFPKNPSLLVLPRALLHGIEFPIDVAMSKAGLPFTIGDFVCNQVFGKSLF